VSISHQCISSPVIDIFLKDINDVFMRTTLSISDALLQELRQRAAESQKSLRSVVEETLQIGLGRASSRIKAKDFYIEPHPLHLKEGFKSVSLNQLYDQIEAEKDAASR
jgi:ElaB/YqjD/DUF883 family membrane-anchored ribosome-binding protein